MKTYSRTEKKVKVHSEETVSGKLSDAELLEIYGLRKCFVELIPVKPDEYDVSEKSSSSQSTEKKSDAKNKLKKSHPKRKGRGNLKHLDPEINGTETLHYGTLEKHTDHIHVPQRNKKRVDLSTKNIGRKHIDSSQHFTSRLSEEETFENQEQAEESDITEADLARKRRTRSSSNSSWENLTLDSGVNINSHETAKLTDFGKRKNIRTESSSSNLISESQNKDSKKKHTSHETAKLTGKGKRRNNRIESSNWSKETLNSVSEYSETILLDNKKEVKDGQKQGRRKRENRTSVDSKREVQDSVLKCSKVVLSSSEETEGSNLTEIDSSRKTRSSSNSSRGTGNFDSEYSAEMLAVQEPTGEKNKVKTQNRKQKNRNSSNSYKKSQNLGSECLEAVITSSEETEESNLTETYLSKENRTRSSSNSSRGTGNLDSEYSAEMLAVQEQTNEKRRIKTQKRKQNNRSSNSNRKSQNLDAECSEAVIISPEETEESNLTETDLSRKNRTRSSSNSSRGTENIDSEHSEILTVQEQGGESSTIEIQKRKHKGNRNSSNFNSESKNLVAECLEAVTFSPEETEESNLTETDLSRKSRTRSSSNANKGTYLVKGFSSETGNLDSEYSTENLGVQALADEKTKVKKQKRKQKNGSSSNSNRKSQNLDSECPDTALINQNAEKSGDILMGTSISNSSSEIQNLDFESSEIVLCSHDLGEESIVTETGLFEKNGTSSCSTTNTGTLNLDSACSEENFNEPEHLKKVSKAITRRGRRKKYNSNTETQNLNSETSEVINFEQAEESSLKETDLLGKSRTRSASNSNSGTQDVDSECSKTSSEIQNLDFESSEIVLSSHDLGEESIVTETGLFEKNGTSSCSNTNRGTLNLDSVCSEENLNEPEHLKKVSKAITRRGRRKKYNSNTETQNLNSEISEVINSEQAKESILIGTDLLRKSRTRSASNSNSGTQDVDSKCSKTVLSGQKQTKMDEIDFRENGTRNSSISSHGSQNSNSKCSETVLSNYEQAEVSNLTEIDLSRKNRDGSPSGSIPEIQNLESVCSKEILCDLEQSEENRQEATKRKKTKNVSQLNRETLNFDTESSNSAPISHEPSEKITHMQTRSRKRNRSPSISSRETQNLGSECSQTVIINCERGVESHLSDSSRENQNLDSECTKVLIVNHEQGVESSLSDSSRETKNLDYECSKTLIVNQDEEVESSLQEIDITKNRKRNYSGSSRETENLVSKYSEPIFPNAEQTSEIYQISRVRRRNRSSSNSSEGTRSLNSEYSETLLASCEQAEVSSLTEIDLSEKRESRNSSECGREIQNLDSEFSGESDCHTHVQSVVLRSQAQLPVIKRSRNSSSSSNSLLDIQNLNFKEKNDKQLVKLLKEKKKHINPDPSQKANRTNSVLRTSRATKNSSSAGRNKKPKHQLNLLAKKRSRNNTEISCFEISEELLEPEETQDVNSDLHLAAKKAKNSFSLNNSFSNADFESSEKHNELSLDSNLSSETGSQSPLSLNSKVQKSKFCKNQDEHMQTNENNQMEDALDNETMGSALEFPKQNGIEVHLDQQEEPENLKPSDLHVQEKVKSNCGSSETISASDSDNSCADYLEGNTKQTFSATSFSLNGECESSSSKNFEKGDFETEMESDFDQVDQEDLAMQQSPPQTRARISSCSSNGSNLSNSEIMNESSYIEKSMGVQSDLLKKHSSTENYEPMQNTTFQETYEENGNSEINDTEYVSESLIKPVEMLENPTACETFVESRSRTSSSSSIKQMDLENDEDNLGKQDCHIVSPEISYEESDISDATLLKKYGIKECSVVLTPVKPFSIHYGRPFLKEFARNAYKYTRRTVHARRTNIVDFKRLFRTRLDQFSNRRTFKRVIMKYIRCFHSRDAFLSRRLEMIYSDQAQLREKKKIQKRKILYDENKSVVIDENDFQNKLKALRNRRLPLVLIEHCEKAKRLAKEIIESKRMDIDQDEIGQYLEVDEGESEMDLSDSRETNLDIIYRIDDTLQSHESDETQNSSNSFPTRRYKHSVDESKELNDSNPNYEECDIIHKQIILDSQQDTGIQNHEDDSNCVKRKLCEKVQSQNLDSNPTLELDFHLPLPSDGLKEVIANSQWPQVLVRKENMSIEDHAASPSTAFSEVDCILFQLAGDSEHSGAASELKEVAYDKSTECNPPSAGRETPLSTELFDDASENKSIGTAPEEFFVIDEDDGDSEKNCSFSEEGSEPDQQLFVTDSQENHQNSSLCPS